VTQYYPQPQAYPAPPVHYRNGMGTAALTLGIVGLVVGLIPIVGFAGFVCAILGVIFGAIGLSRAGRGLASNKGVAIAGTIISAIAIVVSFAIFAAFASAVDEATGPATVTPSTGSSVQAPAAATETEPQTLFAAGQTADIEGLRVTAESLKPQAGTLGGRQLCSKVTISNDSAEERSFNGLFEWKIQDPDNIQQSPTPFAKDILSSGELAPGGKVAGNICIDDPGKNGPYLVIYDEIIGGTTVTWATGR
jgi:Domain of unknown function (DUF4352)